MAANPVYDTRDHHDPHDIRATPRFGEKNRKTIPFERRFLAEETQFWTRNVCWDCGGSGVNHHVRLVQCANELCRKCWSYQEIEARATRTIRGYLLPCGHITKSRELNWFHPDCEGCYQNPAGRGWRFQTITLWDLFNAIQREFNILDEATTAEHEALHIERIQQRQQERQQQLQHPQELPRAGGSAGNRYAYGQSEPTAPSASNDYLSPHLPPVSPQTPHTPTPQPQWLTEQVRDMREEQETF